MYDNIPAELRRPDLKQWVCWVGNPDPARPGKLRKTPINPHTGGNAQSNNPETWSDYDTAVAAVDKYGASGIGLMFGAGYMGVDIDDIGDEIAAYQQGDNGNIVTEFIHTLQSYAEYSVSGNGIHILLRGSLPDGGRRKGKVEMYSEGRFFIVTGNAASEYAKIADGTERIKLLHEKYIGGGRQVPTVRPTKQPDRLTDDQLIDKILASKQGDRFRRLMGGDCSEYTSQSEADQALCNILAFWTRKDADQMDSIYRKSELMRDKWDRAQSGSTYGKLTIRKAIRDVQQVWEPKPEGTGITIGGGKGNTQGIVTSWLSPSDKPPRMIGFDDSGNGTRFLDAYGDRVRYSYYANRWLYYDGRRWKWDYEGAIYKMADAVIFQRMPAERGLYTDDEGVAKEFEKWLKKTRSVSGRMNMVKSAEHNSAIRPDELDNHDMLLCTTNGMINLKTGELLPHDRGKMITRISPVDYTDKIDCPRWIDFLDTIFAGDKELIDYIQRAVGYTLTGSTAEQCTFFLYGDGRNGKSTFLSILREVMGDYAANVQPESLMVRNNVGAPGGDIARLNGARLATSEEPSDGMRLNESLVKQLTGGGRITAAKKYENEIEFDAKFKLWMAMNHRPIIRGLDEGMWRRIHLIPFTVRIPDDKLDKNLIYKLRAELPGILKWAVDGCLLWQREGGLNKPASVVAETKSYKMDMDAIGRFVDDCCDPAGTVGAMELYNAYKSWAQDRNEYVFTSTAFGREIGKRYEKTRTARGNVYLGISMRGYSGGVTIGSGGRSHA